VPSAAGSVSARRAVSQVALSGAQANAMMAQFASPSAAAALAFRRSMQSAMRHTQDIAPCRNGIELQVVSPSSTPETITVDTFYDASCTTKWRHLFLTLNSVSTTSGSAIGTLTTYSPSGSVVNFGGIALTYSATSSSQYNVTVNVNEAANATATVYGTLGFSCDVNATAAMCGVGAIGASDSVQQEFGGTVNFSATETAVAPDGSITVQTTGDGSGYTGAPNALSLRRGPGTSWVIAGGSLVDTASESSTFTILPSGALTAYSVTFTDKGNDITVTIAPSGSNAAGTVKQTDTGAIIATFVVDQNGNGTITFANGTVEQIVGWTIIG
jgi:hypothetical protein